MDIEKLYYQAEPIHSEEMNEIIGRPPGRLIKYGTACFFAIIFIFIAVSWIIEYPDTVKGPCVLSATNISRPVVSKINGRLAALFVSEGQVVEENQVLGIIQNTADYPEVMRLAETTQQLRQYAQKEQWDKIEISPIEYNNIGELQSSFSAFYTAYIQMRLFALGGTYTERENRLNAGANYSFKKIVRNRGEFVQRNNKQLSKTVFLKGDSLSMSGESQRVSFEKLELDKQYFEVRADFMLSLDRMIDDVEMWKQKYFLIAPIKGTVIFTAIMRKNQDLFSGEELLYIEPKISSCYARILVSQNNFVKLMLRQPVVIHLQSYPFQEYGSLQGNISYISRAPNGDKQYTVDVDLTQGLVTNTGYKINFSTGLNADAEIITKKTRLLYKVFNKVSIFKTNAPSSAK
jgi:HlyD family secretion protein